MKNQITLKLIASVLIFLIVMLPVSAAKQLNLSYDLNGNLVTGDGKYRVYNDLNQLWKVYNGSSEAGQPLEVLIHHPIEERVWIKRVYYSNGSLKERTFYVTENFVQVKNISGTFNYTYVYHEGQLIAQNINGKKQFISTDLEGSSTVITNSTGQQIENSTYDPYGNLLTGGTASKLGYTGKEFDAIVDDSDLNARRYKPKWGIFLQPDKIIYNSYDPRSLNSYSYVLNNPYKYTDPTGLWAVLINLGAGAVTSSAGWQASLGPGISYSNEKGLELGFIGSESKGGSYFYGAEGAISVSISPKAKGFTDLFGSSKTKGFSIAYGHGGSLDVSTSDSDNSIKTYSVAYSPGLSLEGHILQTDSGGSYVTIWNPKKQIDKSGSSKSESGGCGVIMSCPSKKGEKNSNTDNAKNQNTENGESKKGGGICGVNMSCL